MSDLIILLIPIAYMIHGFATAIYNDNLKLFSYPLMAAPFFIDLATNQISEYSHHFLLPAWQFIILIFVAILIIAISWIIGYGFGKLIGEKT